MTVRIPPPEPAPELESYVLREVLLAVAAVPGVVAWRQNSGLYYAPDGRGGFRRVRAAMPGCADILGWVRLGSRPVAAFMALEVKTRTGRTRPEQTEFLAAVRDSGGLAVVVRSPEAAVEAIRAYREANP